MHQPPPSPFPIGPTARHLVRDIAAAAAALATGPGGTLVVASGFPGGASILAGLRDGALRAALRPAQARLITVAPGPVLSPYDTPATGLASLRLALDGAPLGGGPVPDGLAGSLRAHRLYGSNRFPKAVPPVDALAVGAALALVDPDLAARPRPLRAFTERALAAWPGRLVLAGPEGVPRRASVLSPRLTVLAAPCDPWVLSARAARVYVATPEAGCEARLAGADTVCLASPAGALPDEAALLARCYGAGVHWFDPWTRQPIPVLEAIERVAWLRDRFQGNDRRVVYVGISRWKRPALDVFGQGPCGPPIHTMTAQDAVAAARRNDAAVRAWATRAPERLPALCTEAGLPFARIEDGFLRSVGLGASLEPGASIVVDDGGIYYDPRTESRLARLLKETAFSDDLVARAGALREAIVARRLSKYNVGLTQSVSADWPAGRRIVLVPGQVEDDASVQYGSPLVRSNLALLRAARARNPDAFLLYKPHPDVEAGYRPGAIPQAEALALADRIVGGLAIVDLLDRVHHVETMTSLAGFEARIRGLSVAVHGRPFYAGWGLTEDLAPGVDRGRRLTLDELTAGALILYPSYLDPVAMKPCEPEQLLERLTAARDAALPSALALGGLRHRVMRARYALFNPIVARLRARRGVGGAPR